MAAAPKAVDIRAYNVGFGDCLLVTFRYTAGDKHLLIDFGSTRLPDIRAQGGHHLEQIAKRIASDCGHKLTAVIATHRHKDHLSGFARNGKKGPGAIIRALRPEVVLQPWTEDPRVARDASGPPPKRMGTRARLWAGSLADMNRFADYARRAAPRLRGKHIAAVRAQLEFLGDDNELANRSAVVNLMTMGKRPSRYLYAGAPSGLESLLPGVKVHVLGPPTLDQDERVANQTDENPREFWATRASFWAKRAAVAAATSNPAAPLFPKHVLPRVPWEARWYRYYAQRELADSMLSIVRTLDDAMNNTSLILLFQIGDTCLLFPGDAQWENWRYALAQKKTAALLENVRVYKVGHHGSRNATPKSLWRILKQRGGASKDRRLVSVLSTKDGVHGESIATAVPRQTLVDTLRKESDLVDTRDTDGDPLCRRQTIQF